MAATEAQKAAAQRWRAKNPGSSTAYNQVHPGYQAAALHKSRSRNKERAKAIRKAWDAAHPGYNALVTLKCNHAKLERAAGRPRPKHCEVCGSAGQICFDHDHITGLFRGWLCARCNHAVGHARDSTEVLMKLVKYIKDFEKRLKKKEGKMHGTKA